MHLETLKTFCDLVETRSLSRAAELNHITQSAVSQQLRALEQRFGHKLIDRAPRVSARATQAGQLLYDEVSPMLRRLQQLEERLRQRPDVVSGNVRVATVYSVGLHTLPPAMKKFIHAHPAVNLRLEYRRTNLVYEGCMRGEVDLGIVALPVRRPQLEIVALRRDELMVVAAPEHVLARRRGLHLADLQGQPFIAFDRDIPTRKLIDRTLKQHGVSVRLAMELDNIETIKRSVEAGLGLSILPAPAVVHELRARSLVARRVAEGPLLRPIGVIYHRRRELSPATQAFLNLLARELGERG
jgi:LysR family transcriptional regulator, transcriptional activator of the cysJI operon